MNSIYPIQVALIWGFLIAFYYLFLGNITFFRSNRYYLIGALLIGLVVPIIQPYLVQNQVGIQPILLPTITITNQITAIKFQQEAISKTNWISIIYWIGVVLMSLRFLKGIIGLIWLVNGNRKVKSGQFTIVHLEKEMSPFSFLNYIFIHKKTDLSEEEWEQIYIHESTHSKQWHSIDILFTEILKIIFWWNPFIYIYQKALQEVHEYEADNAVKDIKNTKQYGLLLMKQSLSGNHAALSNGFINSQLKKRIIMMTRKRSSELTKMRYVWSLPLLFLLAMVTFGEQLNAQTAVKGEPVIAQTMVDTIITFDPETFDETTEIVESIVWENHDLDNIAILKGCQNLANEKEQTECSNQRLLSTLYANIKYPEKAIQKKKEGEVVIGFSVNDYKTNYYILEDPGYGMGMAVLVALHQSDLEWIPAEHNGKSVATKFKLPIKFVLSEKSEFNILEKCTGIKDVKITFDYDKLDIRFSNPSLRSYKIYIYNKKGDLKYTDGAATDYFTIQSLDVEKEVIVVLKDKAGHKLVRKVTQK